MRKGTRPQQIARIATKRARRAAIRKDAQRGGSKPLCRREFKPRERTLIAYDLETTRIAAGKTPRPLYVTAYSEDFSVSVPITSSVKNPLGNLGDVLVARFLTSDNHDARFVAWNGNNFDVYMIALALLALPQYTLRPYLTRSKNLRGLKVIDKTMSFKMKMSPRKTACKVCGAMQSHYHRSWEFLDGIAMTGPGITLAAFLKLFAPEYAKLQGPDFEAGEDFDARNADHVRYAERDSEGLWHGMMKAEAISLDVFGLPLSPTIGNLGIKIFQMNVPVGVECWKPNFAAMEAIRNQVLRGGFCYVARRFKGPIWKYDINQAYAAAMRDAKLPAGNCYWNPPTRWKLGNINPYAKTFIVRVRGTHPASKAPFYLRDMQGEPVFSREEIPETWITSIEYFQLEKEGARLEVLESYFWDDAFSMKEFVDRLERERMSAEGGPSGSKGTFLKNVGNNAYGKTVERLDGLEIVMALDQPEGYASYQTEQELQHIWFKFGEPVMREYHQPQLGAFITAQVRMVLRRAILLDPEHWLSSDTDSVAFSRPVALSIDAKRYGLWKEEEAGSDYLIIDKKVYAKADGKIKHAKGMNVKRLSIEDFENWYEGRPPLQQQVHRQNFVKFIAGAEMFTARDRVGSRVSK